MGIDSPLSAHYSGKELPMSKSINTEVNEAGVVTTKVTEVAPWRTDLLKEKAQAINKHAIKLGLPQILFTISPVYKVERVVVDPILGLTKVQVPVVDLVVTGQQIKLAGHIVVGTVEALGDTALVHHLPEFSELDLSQYRDWAGQCDHCHKLRSRKSAVILQSLEGLLVVGKSCLVDFTGAGLSPEFLALYAGFHTSEGFFGGGDDDEYWLFGGKSKTCSPLSRLVTTCTVARVYGFCSKKRSTETGLPPTTCFVDILHSGNTESKSYKEIIKDIKKAGGFTDADAAKAQEILEWVKAVPAGSSDYLWNLKALCAAERIPTNRSALVVSAYGSYAAQQLKDSQPKAEKDIPKGFIGAVGERLVVEAEVERVTYREGDYGCTTILSLKDAAGHKLVWFASGSKDFKVGEQLKGKASIKAHKVDAKWGDSTILTRCAF